MVVSDPTPTTAPAGVPTPTVPAGLTPRKRKIQGLLVWRLRGNLPPGVAVFAES
jgi:hypothetical protein